jgi:preprotein translocase subunit SecD
MSFKNIFTAICLSGFSAITFGQKNPVSLDFQLVSKHPTSEEMKVEGTNESVFLEQPSLTLKDVLSAKMTDPSCTTSCIIEIKFNKEGAKKLSKITRTHLNRKMGIVLNGKLLSAPTIKEKIVGGNVQINGQFDKTSASKIIESINKAKERT